MKKAYVTPSITSEYFEANEYVASCVEARVQCAYPGRSSTAQDDGTSTYIDSVGAWHGLCGEDASVAINSTTGKGYEVSGGVVQKNRIITVDNIPTTKGTYLNQTWKSTDGAGVYTHKGRIVVTNVDDTHPNHS